MNTVTLLWGQEVLQSTIIAETIKEVVCVCDKCKVAYKERPFVCVCRANVFLRDI